MLTALRADLISALWNNYLRDIQYFSDTFGDNTPNLDHFAIIDLKSEHSGIKTLSKIFSLLGFELAGNGYLPEKHNDFIWMRETGFATQEIATSLPQIVLADFRTELLSEGAQAIISKYTSQVTPFDFATLEEELCTLETGDNSAHQRILDLITNYTSRRPWAEPTTEDYQAIKAENELIAWVLLMGRKVNHFGVQINGYSNFEDLQDFLQKFKDANFSRVNKIKGEIKGGHNDGIAQASSLGEEITVATANGSVIANNSFMEFVWRYPTNSSAPKRNADQYMEFVAKNANYVVESLIKQ